MKARKGLKEEERGKGKGKNWPIFRILYIHVACLKALTYIQTYTHLAHTHIHTYIHTYTHI